MTPAGSSPSVQVGGLPPGGDPPRRPPRQSPCDTLSGALAVFAQGVRAGVSQTLALSSMIAMRLLFRASGDRNAPATLAAAGAVVLLHDVFSLADALRAAHPWVHTRSTAAGTVAPMAWRHRLMALGIDLAMMGLAVAESFRTADSDKGESFQSVLLDKAGSLVGIKLRAFVRDLVQTLGDHAGLPRIVVRMPGGGPLPAGLAEGLSDHIRSWMVMGYMAANFLTVLIDSEGEDARSESASYPDRRDAMFHGVTASVLNELAEVLVEVAAMMRFASQERLELYVEIPGAPSKSLREFMDTVYAKSTVRNLILTAATVGGSVLALAAGDSKKAQAALGALGTAFINGGVEVTHPGILRAGAERLRRADLMRGWVAQAGLEGDAASLAVDELSKHLKDHPFPRGVWDDDDALDAAVRWFAAKDPHRGERLREFQEVSTDAQQRQRLSAVARQIVCAVRPDLNTMLPSEQRQIDDLQRALMADVQADEGQIDTREALLEFARDWFKAPPDGEPDGKHAQAIDPGKRCGKATDDEIDDRIAAYERAMQRTPGTRPTAARGVLLDRRPGGGYDKLKGEVLHELGLAEAPGLDDFVKEALGRGGYWSEDVVLAMSAWADLHRRDVDDGERVMAVGFRLGLSSRGPIGAAREKGSIETDVAMLVDRVIDEALAQGALMDERRAAVRAGIVDRLGHVGLGTMKDLRALYLRVAALATEHFGPGVGEAVRRWGYVDGVYGHQRWHKPARATARAAEESKAPAFERRGRAARQEREQSSTRSPAGRIKALLDARFRGPATVTVPGASPVRVEVVGSRPPLAGPVMVEVSVDGAAAAELLRSGAKPVGEPDESGRRRLLLRTDVFTVDALPAGRAPAVRSPARERKAGGGPAPSGGQFWGAATIAVEGAPAVEADVVSWITRDDGTQIVQVLADHEAAAVLESTGAKPVRKSQDPPGVHRLDVSMARTTVRPLYRGVPKSQEHVLGIGSVAPRADDKRDMASAAGGAPPAAAREPESVAGRSYTVGTDVFHVDSDHGDWLVVTTKMNSSANAEWLHQIRPEKHEAVLLRPSTHRGETFHVRKQAFLGQAALLRAAP